MAYSYDIDEASSPKLPSLSHDIQRAKMFLMKHSSESENSLYDHLSELLSKILSERPKNALEVFENYSKKLKNERVREKSNLLDLYLPPAEYSEAEKLIKLFQVGHGEQEIYTNQGDDENEFEKSPPDILDLFYHFEQINISLPRSDVILLNLSIEKLVKERPITNARFWGKILGRPKNYYVVEAELSEKELSRRLEQVDEDVAEEEKQDGASEEETKIVREVEGGIGDPDGNISKSDQNESTLLSTFSVLPESGGRDVVPSEQLGTGANKKVGSQKSTSQTSITQVFFVCNSPGLDDWIELPPVTPRQIVVARQILRYFTGCLETPIHTYPEFPGNEANYLRAQIARISATTLISPTGYFTFAKSDEDIDDEDIEDEEVEDETGRNIWMNSHYEPLPIKELTDPSLSNWCHHSAYILEQGRTTWWNPVNKEEDLNEEVEEEEDEEMESEKQVIKEIAPPLLTPLSEDALIDTIPPWTTRVSSEISRNSAVAAVRSNLWPGAVAFAKDKKVGNIYIGTGQKFETKNYAPPILPIVQEQYKLGPEVMEMEEPSFEAEEAYRIAHLPPTKESDSENEREEEEDEDDEGDIENNLLTD